MSKYKCEQCKKEFDRPRKQPYCSRECFNVAEVKRKNEYLNVYRWLTETDKVYFPRFLQLARRERLDWEFKRQIKKEVMKGSYKAFLTNEVKTIEGFLQYVLNLLIVKRD